MAEEKKSSGSFHLYAQVSKTYYSYKKPGDGKAFTSMYVQNHDGMITFRFHKQVTSENKQDLNCYLPISKLWAFARILEGMVARRRDAYLKGENYNPSESWTIPTTAYRDGQEVSTGKLTLDTEMYDGVPKVRLTYTDFEKDQSVEFVFNSRVPNGDITGTNLDGLKLDFADLDVFNFTSIVKTIVDEINPNADYMYRLADSIVNDLKRYISGCFRNMNGGNRGASSTSSFNNQSFGEESYDAF